MAKLDDLTILLKSQDNATKDIKRVQKHIVALKAASKAVGKAGAVAMAAIGAGAIAAGKKGQQLTTELQSMSRQLNTTLPEAQALFNAVRDADESTNLDNLNEALLSIKERFADARVGAGPLKGLMDDFAGFNLDLGVDNARDQLADFLEQVSKLPDANAKIFALKEVVGDADARPFFNMINNTEKLNTLLTDLRTNVNELPDLITPDRQLALEQYRQSAAGLNREWEDMGIAIFGVASGPLSGFQTAAGAALAAITRVTNETKLTGGEAMRAFDITVLVIGKVLRFVDIVRGAIAGVQAMMSSAVGAIAAILEVAVKGINAVVQKIPFLRNKWGEATADMLQEIEFFRIGAEAQVTDLLGDSVALITGEGGLAAAFREEAEKAKAALAEIKIPTPPATIPTPPITAPATVPEAPPSTPAAPVVRDLPDVPAVTHVDLTEGSRLADIYGQQGQRDPLEVARGIEAMNDLMQDSTQKATASMTAAWESAGSAFDTFTQGFEGRSVKTFNVFKKIQVAIAVASALSAAVQAAADPAVPGLAKVAAYLNVAAVLGRAVKQLKGVKVGSAPDVSAGGGSATGGNPQSAVGGTLQPQQTASNRSLNLTIEGDGNITPQQLEKIVEGMIDNGFIEQGKVVRI